MVGFIRKNVLTFATTFTANDGSMTQPGAATCVLTYPIAKGIPPTTPGGALTPPVMQTIEIQMTYNPTLNQWSCTWDSSAAVDGTVSWMIYGYGTLQAATQGEFEVVANAANTV